MMTRITFIEFDGTAHMIEADDDASAMEAAVRNDVPGIPAECGGACACATCHVYVDPEWLARLAPMGEVENDLLDLADERRGNSRLSCQLMVTPELEGLVLQLPQHH